ncbi:uncharacterized protein [Diadema antillarum]|uniref:uncharacterized protein n=1 Tax=Diadema antillarum TaxID=105358 RepID=UPI003A84F001
MMKEITYLLLAFVCLRGSYAQDCDFSTDLCGYVNGGGSLLQWARVQGLGADPEYYLSVQMDPLATPLATLTSPAIANVPGNTYRIQFTYQIIGDHTLHVRTSGGGGGGWEDNGNTTAGGWETATFVLSSESDPFNIIFIADVGTTEDFSSVAIADLVLITDVNYCDPSPCFNDGECYVTGDGYLCICINGYDGTNCTEPPTTAPPITTSVLTTVVPTTIELTTPTEAMTTDLTTPALTTFLITTADPTSVAATTIDLITTEDPILTTASVTTESPTTEALTTVELTTSLEEGTTLIGTATSQTEEDGTTEATTDTTTILDVITNTAIPGTTGTIVADTTEPLTITDISEAMSSAAATDSTDATESQATEGVNPTISSVITEESPVTAGGNSMEPLTTGLIVGLCLVGALCITLIVFWAAYTCTRRERYGVAVVEAGNGGTPMMDLKGRTRNEEAHENPYAIAPTTTRDRGTQTSLSAVNV